MPVYFEVNSIKLLSFTATSSTLVYFVCRDAKGQDVHCIISRGPDGYGFADPFKIHEHLMDLVLHYRETSLAEHNPSLNCRLLYPAYLPQES